MDVKKDNTEQWDSKLFRTVNSAICFSIAYVLFNYLYWFAMVFAAKSYKAGSFLYYYGVKMLLSSNQWDIHKVTFVYSAGPLACLFVGLLCLFLYRLLRQLPYMINVFLLWGFVTGTGMFLAQGIIIWLGIYNYGSAYYQGLAVVFSWWRMPAIAARALTIPFALLFVYFALNYGKPFLMFSFSYSRINKLTRKRKYFFEIALVPFAFGALLTTVFTYPMNMAVHFINLLIIGLALCVTWYTLNTIKLSRNQLLRYTILQAPNVVFMVLFVLVCLLVVATYRGMYVAL